MEKQQRSSETVEEPTLYEAQQTAAWLVEYLYGDGEPVEMMSDVTEERLRTLFTDAQEATWLGRFKAIFTHLEPGQQAVAGLYVAGYSYSAIAALAETSLADMLTAVRHQVALKEQRKPNLSTVRAPSAYIPLRTITDQMREPVLIDEVKLKEACHAINELEPDTLAERLRQLPQYLPAPTKDMWLRVVTEWLDGRSAIELAASYGLNEQATGAQLARAGKILLKDRPTTAVNRALTRDDLEWQTHALCTQTGGDYFFPEQGEPTRDAKKICAACEVKPQCEEYGKRTGQAYGILAGKSADARNKEKKLAKRRQS